MKAAPPPASTPARTSALKDLGYQAGDFPLAEKAAGEILSLPMDPHITEAQQERVVEVLRRALGVTEGSMAPKG